MQEEAEGGGRHSGQGEIIEKGRYSTQIGTDSEWKKKDREKNQLKTPRFEL